MGLRLGPGDIDAIFRALRPRLRKWISSGGFSSSPPARVAPHTHQADDIGFDPAGVEWTGYVDGDDVQEAIEELDDEKLARSGVQPMEGHLNMDDGLGPWRIFNILDLYLTGGAGAAAITGSRAITMKGTTVGEDVISNVRVLTFIGDDDDDEARAEGLDRVKFNATPTQAVIEDPARIELQTAVDPGTDYTEAEGITSWSETEATMVVCVASGPGS